MGGRGRTGFLQISILTTERDPSFFTSSARRITSNGLSRLSFPRAADGRACVRGDTGRCNISHVRAVSSSVRIFREYSSRRRHGPASIRISTAAGRATNPFCPQNYTSVFARKFSNIFMFLSQIKVSLFPCLYAQDIEKHYLNYSFEYIHVFLTAK